MALPRLLGAIYLCAFASLWPQLPGLVGERGILPARDFLAAAAAHLDWRRYWLVPSLAWLGARSRAG